MRYSNIVLAAFMATSATAQSNQVTVPLIFENNRPFVELSLRKSDGTIRKARFLLDTGGGGFLITEPLAKELGIKTGETSREEGQTISTVTSPVAASIADFALELQPDRTFVVGAANILPPAAGAQADGMIPGHVLSKYHVVFDYPARTFTIAKPGVLAPKGTAFPMPVKPSSGFPRTEIVIDGKTYGLLLDTGASFTMVSENLLKALGTTHPSWPRAVGAVGEAKLLGGMTLETMTVADAKWSTFTLTNFGVTSQRDGTFERYMSGMMAAPIMGSLAGNVLRDFRVDLDYAHQQLYLSR